MFKTKSMLILSTLFILSSSVLALEINTDIDNAVQTIKRTIYTPSGNFDDVHTVIIDANNPDGNVLKVIGKTEIGSENSVSSQS